MRILLSNDDGIYAAGLEALRAALDSLGEVWVVAPDREQSAVGQSISIHSPLRVRELAARRFAVSGTPADSVYMALAAVLPDRPDLVVSGINHGVNLAEDVFYSGTVAAANEAALRNIPSLALSQDVRGFARGIGDAPLTGPPDFRAAAAFARGLVETFAAWRADLPRRSLLNVNVPIGPPKGVRVAFLGERNYVSEVEKRTDPRDNPYYWIGGTDSRPADIPGSDCNLLAEGYITVTPLRLDVTARDLFERVERLVEPAAQRVAALAAGPGGAKG
jgi:5'-nucleotidase